jgi:hypothetical protein
MTCTAESSPSLAYVSDCSAASIAETARRVWYQHDTSRTLYPAYLSSCHVRCRCPSQLLAMAAFGSRARTRTLRNRGTGCFTRVPARCHAGGQSLVSRKRDSHLLELRKRQVLALMPAIAFLGQAGPSTAGPSTGKDFETTASGLQILDLRCGESACIPLLQPSRCRVGHAACHTCHGLCECTRVRTP